MSHSLDIKTLFEPPLPFGAPSKLSASNAPVPGTKDKANDSHSCQVNVDDVSLKQRLAFLDLPTEIHLSVLDHLDRIDSTCLCLTNRHFYVIHHRRHGTVPLSARRNGPNDMEWAWRFAGHLLPQSPSPSDSKRGERPADENEETPEDAEGPRCRICGVTGCELARHIRATGLVWSFELPTVTNDPRGILVDVVMPSSILCGATALFRRRRKKRRGPRPVLPPPIQYRRSQEALGIYDIVILIVHELADILISERRHWNEFSRYATVSVVFQDAVESISFRHFRFFVKPGFSINQFTKAFSALHRRNMLFGITIVAPARSYRAKKREDAQDGCIEGLIYDAVFLIFQELHSWEAGMEGKDLGPIHLELNGCCCSDPWSWIERLDDEHRIRQIPVVRSIRSLFRSDKGRKQYPDNESHSLLPLQLATRTPNLKALGVAYPVIPGIMGEHFRASQHHNFARALHGLRSACPELEELLLWREYKYPKKKSVDLEDCGVDPVCEAIRLIAEDGRLKTLYLSNMVLSPDLFRNRRIQHRSGSQAPPAHRRTVWPSLRHLDIGCDTAASIDPVHNNRVREFFRPHVASSSHPDSENCVTSEIFDRIVRDMLDVQLPMLEIGHLRLQTKTVTGRFYEGPVLSYMPQLSTSDDPWKWLFCRGEEWTPPKGLSTKIETIEVEEHVC
ncbi:hypothetical protein CSOJ01_08883 [Colletotrichum sojae]|uniref:F-box domain-containing protein n=1 Tax=Colletotrichum sojae TaxID=2175907 RepID=A0A8H6MS94_9PEZI|nr:hypothetical protein CSOJ01_08883 [Colletotrichum sojae]